jgi:hypothetical protein
MAATIERERRASPRMSPGTTSGMDRARLRPGRLARIVDLSAVGALIETDWRLLPGLRVEVQLGDPAPLCRVRARILRCHVALVGREHIRYRAGLAFDERIPFGELTTPT